MSRHRGLSPPYRLLSPVYAHLCVCASHHMFAQSVMMARARNATELSPVISATRLYAAEPRAGVRWFACCVKRFIFRMISTPKCVTVSDTHTHKLTLHAPPQASALVHIHTHCKAHCTR